MYFINFDIIITTNSHLVMYGGVLCGIWHRLNCRCLRTLGSRLLPFIDFLAADFQVLIASLRQPGDEDDSRSNLE